MFLYSFHCAHHAKCPSIIVVGQDWCLTSLSLTVLISRTVYSLVWVDRFYNIGKHTYYTYVDWVSEHQGGRQIPYKASCFLFMAVSSIYRKSDNMTFLSRSPRAMNIGPCHLQKYE